MGYCRARNSPRNDARPHTSFSRAAGAAVGSRVCVRPRLAAVPPAVPPASAARQTTAAVAVIFLPRRVPTRESETPEEGEVGDHIDKQIGKFVN
eukprot:5162367-Pleurochrysis_carterae.AAC.2